MKESDKYHKWVEWDEGDRVYIGKCPDLITGIHGENPVVLYGELCEVIEDIIGHFKGEVNGWFKTDKCGPMGFIHKSQIRY